MKPRFGFPSIKVFALLLLATTAARAQNGTWTNLVSGSASGSWATAANWNNSVIADGSDNTADFSTLDITSDSAVTLDGARTIGNLKFGDAAPGNNWSLTTGTGGPLMLSVTTGQPTITATSGSNNISAVLASTLASAGLTKNGEGLLRLSTANLLTNINANVNAGVLLLANNNALGYVNASVGSNVVANGATLRLAAAAQAASQRVFISGAGLGGTNGALRADAGTGAQQNTRWSFALNSVANPAIVLTGDATIRVDGSGYTTQAGFLVGAVTNDTSDLAYTLTIDGTGEFRVDPPAEIAVANINIAGGVLGLNGNGPNNITRTQVVTVASGAALGCRRNHAYNAPGSFLTLNGTLDLNYNQGATANTGGNTWYQRVGSLQGGGAVTNSSLAPQTLYVVSDSSNSVFSGTVDPGARGPITFRKEGQNTTMWLSGSSTFSGTNILTGGIQYINGAWNPSGGFSVSAQSGATTAMLAGNGSTVSQITLGAGGIVSAGDPTSGGGTFSVSTVNSSGGGDVIVSNAHLIVSGTLGSASSYLNSVYLTNGTLSIPLLADGASVFASTVTVDGNVTIAYTSGNPTVGQFPLIAYSALGGLAGGDTNGITLVPPAGTTAYLSNNAANATLDVVITGIPALVWNGNINGNWDIAGTANWLSGVTPSTYAESSGVGPFVTFDDTASGTTTVSLDTTVSPKGITVNNSSKNYTLTGSGVLNGAGGLLKQGSGTLTLANSGANTLAGPITISAGAVQVGNGSTSGNLGSAAVVNNGSLVFNRSDDVVVPNSISGSGSLIKQAANTVTLSGIGDVPSPVTVNAGTLALGPSGTITVSGDVTGSGAFGVAGAGTVILSSYNNTYAGGTVISNGTLQFGDAVQTGTLPPSGNIVDNGTLAISVSGALANNVSGNGGLSILNGAGVTLTGANSYAGKTIVQGSLTVNAATALPSSTALTLGDIAGGAAIGTASLDGFNPVLGGLNVGGNDAGSSMINLTSGNQSLTILGNVAIGNTPSTAQVNFSVAGSGVSVLVQTNGGTIQIGLGSAGSGINPDNVVADFSANDKFIADLGATGTVNLGTLDGNPGPPAGATVVNQLKLAAISNSISAGTITIGAGGRQLVPELRLGAGTNELNVNALNVGTGGRDGGNLLFDTATGSVRVRAYDGVSRASMNVGVNAVTGTGAGVINTVDLTGHDADLLLDTLVIGNYPIRNGAYENTFSFNQGVLDALSTSLSAGRNANNPGASTLNLGGGIVTLGPVSLTASPASGTLNITGGTVTVANITSPGAGTATLNISDATLNLALVGTGNPAAAPVIVDDFTTGGTVNLGVNGTNFAVGQFPLISYAGSINGSGFAALHLSSLPSGVSATLSNNTANFSVDLVITAAPPVVNLTPTNIIVSVSGNTLNLSWPADHLGWKLETNAVSLTAADQWFVYPGSDLVTNVPITINPSKTNVFFRLKY